MYIRHHRSDITLGEAGGNAILSLEVFGVAPKKEEPAQAEAEISPGAVVTSTKAEGDVSADASVEAPEDNSVAEETPTDTIKE